MYRVHTIKRFKADGRARVSSGIGLLHEPDGLGQVEEAGSASDTAVMRASSMKMGEWADKLLQ